MRRSSAASSPCPIRTSFASIRLSSSPRRKLCAASKFSTSPSPRSRAGSGSTEQRKVLKGAFIGFGNVAANGHMPGWRARDDVRIIAATDAAASREQAFLAACPDGRWHETVDDLLSGEKLDFVDICAPPGSHAPLIERALDAGLHVLSEKPLVTRAEDAERVAGAAARSGRVLHTVHNWLCAPVCRKISALVEEGAIGPVRSVRWRTLRTQPAIAVSAEGSRTGASTPPRRAAASCSITAGTRSIASRAGPALRTASQQRSRRAASTISRSRTRRALTSSRPAA